MELKEPHGRLSPAPGSSYLRGRCSAEFDFDSSVETLKDLNSGLIASIRSISDEEWGTYSPTHRLGEVEGDVAHHEVLSRVTRIAKPPKIEKALAETESGDLRLLASSSVRGLELLFDNGKTHILLSSCTPEDMERYRELLESVYGEMVMEPTDEGPAFLRELPRIVGLIT